MTVEGLIGKKLGMSQLYGDNSRLVPVTVIAAGPCRVTQKKTMAVDGYEAVQLSYQELPEKKLTAAERGHFKKVNVPFARYLREFAGDLKVLEVGTVLTADQFQAGEHVDITGLSKGKGFAGVMKLHHFAGGPATHGSMFHRQPGSIGSSSWPSRVRKGKRLPAHMGVNRVTVQNLEVVEVRKDENLLLVRGAVPGYRGSLLLIKRSHKRK